MAASSKLMITEAERRFPARIRIAVPPEGLGRQLADMTAWLDANCGAGGWAVTPAGLRGVVNDALAIYFLDTALANAFVTRWCLGYRVETVEGSFRLRGDAPTPRVAAALHRTP
jgi:hypothetical protein